MVGQGYIFGKLLVTTTRQSQGAPILDGCRTNADARPGAVFAGVAIRLQRDVGHRLPLALVLAIEGGRSYRPRAMRKAQRRPVWYADAMTNGTSNGNDNASIRTP